MSTPQHRGEVAAPGRPPAPPGEPAPGAAVTPAAQVLDAELLDDTQLHRPHHYPRAASWWQRSPRVPTALKSRANDAQAAKDAAVTVVGSPWRLVRATGRGTVLAIRVWPRWVTVRDYRQAAEQSEKLADKYLEIRELTPLPVARHRRRDRGWGDRRRRR